MRDQAKIDKLKSRIHSLEHQSLELQKQLKGVNETLHRLLDETSDMKRPEMQKPDRDKLS
jgi:predicted  nucleic acid-binding Zn-ribbon protein